jgi:DNA ligase-3
MIVVKSAGRLSFRLGDRAIFSHPLAAESRVLLRAVSFHKDTTNEVSGKGGQLLYLKPVTHSEGVKLGSFAVERMADNRYCIEYAKTGRSGCKKCKSQLEKGVARMGKITPNPFSDDGGEMKVWYHMRCMFETLKRARTAKKIETPADIEGFPDMKDEEKDELKKLIAEFDVPKPAPKTAKGKGGKAALKAAGGATQTLLAPPSKPSTSGASPKKMMSSSATVSSDDAADYWTTAGASDTSPDNRFSEFRRVCGMLEVEPSYNAKTKIVADFIKNGSTGGIDHFTLDLLVVCSNT